MSGEMYSNSAAIDAMERCCGAVLPQGHEARKWWNRGVVRRVSAGHERLQSTKCLLNALQTRLGILLADAPQPRNRSYFWGEVVSEKEKRENLLSFGFLFDFALETCLSQPLALCSSTWSDLRRVLDERCSFMAARGCAEITDWTGPAAAKETCSLS